MFGKGKRLHGHPTVRREHRRLHALRRLYALLDWCDRQDVACGVATPAEDASEREIRWRIRRVQKALAQHGLTAPAL
jgi:hypothetical protein